MGNASSNPPAQREVIFLGGYKLWKRWQSVCKSNLYLQSGDPDPLVPSWRRLWHLPAASNLSEEKCERLFFGSVTKFPSNFHGVWTLYKCCSDWYLSHLRRCSTPLPASMTTSSTFLHSLRLRRSWPTSTKSCTRPPSTPNPQTPASFSPCSLPLSAPASSPLSSLLALKIQQIRTEACTLEEQSVLLSSRLFLPPPASSLSLATSEPRARDNWPTMLHKWTGGLSWLWSFLKRKHLFSHGNGVKFSFGGGGTTPRVRWHYIKTWYLLILWTVTARAWPLAVSLEEPMKTSTWQCGIQRASCSSRRDIMLTVMISVDLNAGKVLGPWNCQWFWASSLKFDCMAIVFNGSYPPYLIFVNFGKPPH